MYCLPRALAELWDGYAAGKCVHPDDSIEHAGHEGLIVPNATATFIIMEAASGAVAMLMCPGMRYQIQVKAATCGTGQR